MTGNVPIDDLGGKTSYLRDAASRREEALDFTGQHCTGILFFFSFLVLSGGSVGTQGRCHDTCAGVPWFAFTRSVCYAIDVIDFVRPRRPIAEILGT